MACLGVILNMEASTIYAMRVGAPGSNASQVLERHIGFESYLFLTICTLHIRLPPPLGCNHDDLNLQTAVQKVCAVMHDGAC